MSIQFSPFRSPLESLQEYGRGLAGGLIFSLPLLFTMEVWQASFTLRPGRLALHMVATWLVLLLYNRFAGLRENRASWSECAIDSVEEMGLGLLLAAWVLWLCGQLEPEMGWLEIGGKIIKGGLTVAVGVSVGTAQLGDSGAASREDSDSNSEETGVEGENADADADDFLSQMALAFCGAVLIASNIAPTEEVFLIAAQISPFKMLLMALFSVVLGAGVLFFSEFRGAPKSANLGAFGVTRIVVSTYAVALFASAGALYFFGRFEGESFSICVSQIVVVGLAGTLGASAGRLLLQPGGGGNG